MIERHTDRKITLQISKDALKNSAIYGTIILHKQNIKKQRAEGMGKVVVLMEHLEQYLQHTLLICWISRFRINDNYDHAKLPLDRMHICHLQNTISSWFCLRTRSGLRCWVPLLLSSLMLFIFRKRNSMSPEEVEKPDTWPGPARYQQYFEIVMLIRRLL